MFTVPRSAQADPVTDTMPWFEIWRHWVPVFPRFEIVRLEVEARFETRRAEVEAKVVIER